ncbi:hypothetical protein BB561_002336 [Smittium simulii]|uniref:Magnesium transporter n=1 Tax=Smittium simulii TaxID=133385 RepID=A0A2T9YR16_9FUNG|nr:hypothetical protein BB561_002336 [Smittium simulii]
MNPKIIGMILATLSSLLIGTSFVITKMGLNHAALKYGSATEKLSFIKSHIWWIGMICMIAGEILNFLAYGFAPAILVTPLGALSVIFGAFFASIFLKEIITVVGKCACALCLLGSIQVVVNSPEDPPIVSIKQIVDLTIHPIFLTYSIIIIVAILVLILFIVPKFGDRSPITFISICSLAGSLTVICAKALGIALKLTFSGNNQLRQPAPYIYLLLMIIFTVTQIIYFNKVLDKFDTNIVTPIYYVFFSTATIAASIIMFRGFDGTPTELISIISGFLQLFVGVFLLNFSRYKVEKASFFEQREDENIEFLDLAYPINSSKNSSTPIRSYSQVKDNDSYDRVLTPC